MSNIRHLSDYLNRPLQQENLSLGVVARMLVSGIGDIDFRVVLMAHGGKPADRVESQLTVYVAKGTLWYRRGHGGVKLAIWATAVESGTG